MLRILTVYYTENFKYAFVYLQYHIPLFIASIFLLIIVSFCITAPKNQMVPHLNIYLVLLH